MATTLITPEVQALIGTDTPPERNRFPISEEMAYDVADAIEDANPLYVDSDHAKRSRFGGLLCPPLATWKDIAPPIGYFGAGQESHFQVPLPFNSYGLNGGMDWQFLRPAYVGTWITRQFRIIDIYEKQGRSGTLVFVVRRETETDQEGRTVGVAKRISIHQSLSAWEGPRPVTGGSAGADGEPPLKAVVISPPGPDVVLPRPEAPTGQQRYFEDASVGMEVPPVVKGPMTTTHLVRWAAANGNYARIHWDLPFAQLRQGLSNVVVNGSLKNQYLGQLLVNFAGEEGWFKRFYVEHRGMDYPGDLLTAFGTVTGKREQGGFGYVDCQVGLRNNRGEQTASGWATVVLPKRGQSLPLVWEAEE
tara:strand:- start:2037 stop:3122 length:1086 start_codon:yes stop_codon:yes gene_type:complete